VDAVEQTYRANGLDVLLGRVIRESQHHYVRLRASIHKVDIVTTTNSYVLNRVEVRRLYQR